MGTLYTVVIFLLVLGIMIFVHEFGHFIVAKWAGVKVLEFSLGMGPRLVGFKWGETDYNLKPFPIGGQTKMLGEEPGETGEDVVDPAEMDRAFFSQSPQKRIAITAAGPLLNILLALILAPLIYIIGIDVPKYLKEKPVVHSVDRASPGAKAGFQAGDEIVGAGNKIFSNWEDELTFTALNPKKTFKYTVIRQGQKIELTMTIEQDKDRGIGVDGLNPYESNKIGAFAKPSPAMNAGMKVGDKLVSINGEKIDTFDDIVKSVRGSNGNNLAISALRGSEEITFNIKPEFNKKIDAFAIGIAPATPETVKVKYPVGQSIKAGEKFLFGQLALAGISIKKLVTGQLSRKALGGPIEIAFIVGVAAHLGWPYLIKITAIICIWLGALNLFPFPALDGGHIIFATIEIISRRRLNQRVVDVLNQVGFSMLMALIVLVTVQDVWRHWGDSIMKLFS